MKIRNGFVSNSSSSSFICDVCGENQSGFGLSLDDVEMYECENGHTFCISHLSKENEEAISMELESMDEDEAFDCQYGVAARFCPICNFEHICPDDAVAYIKKVYEITHEDAHFFMKSKSKRLRKIRPEYFFGALDELRGVSKKELIEEIKSKFNSLEELYKVL